MAPSRSAGAASTLSSTTTAVKEEEKAIFPFEGKWSASSSFDLFLSLVVKKGEESEEEEVTNLLISRRPGTYLFARILRQRGPLLLPQPLLSSAGLGPDAVLRPAAILCPGPVFCPPPYSFPFLPNAVLSLSLSLPVCRSRRRVIRTRGRYLAKRRRIRYELTFFIHWHQCRELQRHRQHDTRPSLRRGRTIINRNRC